MLCGGACYGIIQFQVALSICCWFRNGAASDGGVLTRWVMIFIPDIVEKIVQYLVKDIDGRSWRLRSGCEQTFGMNGCAELDLGRADRQLANYILNLVFPCSWISPVHSLCRAILARAHDTNFTFQFTRNRASRPGYSAY